MPALSVISYDNIFMPIRPDYADIHVDVRESFRWPEIFARKVKVGKEVALYAFRSVPLPNVDTAILAAFDEKALLAAKGAEGFIHYEPVPHLSYCLWDSTELARRATSATAHREAAAYAVQAYSDWQLLCWEAVQPTAGSPVEFTPVAR